MSGWKFQKRLELPVQQAAQAIQHPFTIGTEAIVFVLVGNPEADAADEAGGFFGKSAFDVHIVVVDGGGDGNGDAL